MQFAFLAQFPREMSQTDRIHPRYFLLRIRVSIRPRYFVNAKKPNTTAAARSMTGQRHRPSDRRNHLNGSFAPSRQVATYVTIALQASQARQRMRSIREEATAAGINTALTLPVSRSKSSPVPEVVAGFIQNDTASYRLCLLCSYWSNIIPDVIYNVNAL